MTHDTRRSVLRKLALGTATLILSRVVPAEAAAATPSGAKKWAAGQALTITFKVATQAGGRVKRPYVAVWIEDAQGNPVRTLSVWAETTGRGPRWIPDLRRWYRENSALLDTVSSATRNPGSYALAWDGKTDKGTLVSQGDYYVCIEAAREHGPYSLVREKVTVGSATFKKTLSANNDIEAASVGFGKA
ncbi:DUF2271 domain-containing protein [Deinococcus hopiensis]|uniref:DUF2271 domain-containing protein n=1 Tax=Deinococcus hopiensis KR-140 TaxID=695939 RepID=A0A1W1UBF5_9DEIO|nr:DUF2271 domain-containing protein [Deinococcus hopiensis]SMB78370.1 Hypothetical protein SAMN00790413_06623 [Deinococcus hopiensis KR-140]